MAKPLKILLVASSIIGFLLLVGFALRVIYMNKSVDTMISDVARMNDLLRKNGVMKLQISLESYHAYSSSKYPASLADLVQAGELSEIPLDPVTKQPYQYTPENSGQTYKLCVNFENTGPACFTPDSHL